MNKLKIQLRMLTPLWTGDAKGRSDRIRETGILGSLRWWYEAMVRGLGGTACDPSQHKCGYDPDKPSNGLCDVCRVFGATGRQRRFRLEIESQTRTAWSGGMLNLRPPGRQRGWYLNAGQVGTVTITIIGDGETRSRLAALFRFLETWGNLGARPQLGYGRFRITDMNGDPGTFHWEAQDDTRIGSLPDLRTFTLFRLRFTPRDADWWTQVGGIRRLRTQRTKWNILTRLAGQGMVPVMPALKNYLRFEQKWSSVSLKHWLFGTLKGDSRVRSKVSFSWAYRLEDGDEWEIRGWVYLPQDVTGRNKRAEVVRTLERALERPSQWFQAMGVEAGYRYPAQVAFEPQPAPWQAHSTGQMAEFVGGMAT